MSFFLATLGNFSCRWTVGVDDIKNENDTKKYIIKKIFRCCTILKKYLILIKNQLKNFFSYYSYLADKYSTYFISFVRQKNIFSHIFCQQVHGHSRFVTMTCHRYVTQNKKIHFQLSNAGFKSAITTKGQS